MKRNKIIALLGILFLANLISLANAAEKSKNVPADKFILSHSTSKPTPAVMTAEGTMVDLNNQSEPATLHLKTKNGKIAALYLHPKDIKVWKGNKPAGLPDLKAGDRIKIRETSKNGKRMVKTIEIIAPVSGEHLKKSS